MSPFLVLLVFCCHFLRFQVVGTYSANQIRTIGAVYFSTNDYRGNYIISNRVHSDGTLSYGNTYSAFGDGSSPVIGTPVDFVKVCGKNLFAVNSGSNTIAMFEINERLPHLLRFVQTFDSKGDSPRSLACSVRLNILCVVNSGQINNVACFSITPAGLVFLPKTLKALGLIPNESTGLGTPSAITFNTNSKLLLVTIKENPTLTPPTFGTIAAFRVSKKGRKLRNAILNTPVGSHTYSLTPIPGTHEGAGKDEAFVFTDPGNHTSAYGLGLFDLASNGKVKSGSLFTLGIPFNKATCWTLFSKLTGNLFTTDFLTGILSEFNIHVGANGDLSATLVKQYKINDAATDMASIQIGGEEYLYVLNFGRQDASNRGIEVLNIKGSGNVPRLQTYVPPHTTILKTTGAILNTTMSGLAYYLSKNGDTTF